MAMIHIENLGKSFGENVIFHDINLDIEKGDCVSVIGPSGCGKSTFLRCINMLEVPTTGHVYINDRDITAKNSPIDEIRRNMGMVYQSFNLFSHKTVLENVVMAPMLVNKMSKKEAIEKAKECLSMVGMTERADFMPSQLSGGQKQRAAIARCIAMNPEFVLFDEPTSALDPTMVGEVLSVIRRLVNNGMTCIIVTHEMSFARSVSSKVIYMDEQGIYEMGSPNQIFGDPKREKTRAFILHVKTFDKKISSKDFDIFEFNSSFENFCRNLMVPPKQVMRMELVLEELLVHVLLPEYDEIIPEIDIKTDFREKEGDFTFSIQFNGKPFEIIENEENSISLTLIKSLSKNFVVNENNISFSM